MTPLAVCFEPWNDEKRKPASGSRRRVSRSRQPVQAPPTPPLRRMPRRPLPCGARRDADTRESAC
jgi:hypothetical protein